MRKIPVFSVVAFSGTGKTTMLEKLVPELKSRGLRVAVVKHDAHAFEIDREGKDSYRMTRAGADVTVITSADKTAFMENRPVSFETVIGRISDVDIILTEGYKTGAYPKIALRRAATGQDFPVDIAGCIALMSDTPVEGADVPVFGLGDVSALAVFLVGRIGLQDIYS
jgi:molybdopterin-guanine dinucleotide biosynthesis protein MobB